MGSCICIMQRGGRKIQEIPWSNVLGMKTKAVSLIPPQPPPPAPAAPAPAPALAPHRAVAIQDVTAQQSSSVAIVTPGEKSCLTNLTPSYRSEMVLGNVKVRKITTDQEDVILVNADGTLNLKKRVGDDQEFRAAKSAKTTTKDRATTIEEKNRELTKRLASLE